MSNPDQIQRILFDELDIRGAVTGLDAAYQEVLDRHDYPDTIQQVLGEMLAAVSLLSTNLKFEGRLSLQAAGEGAVRVLLAEVTHEKQVRAIARYEGEVPQTLELNKLLENGRLALTIEPAKGQRYQGVVSLEEGTLSRCLEAYFMQSEQLPTQIQLVADGQKAAGMLLQVLPVKGHGEEDWNRVSHLASTLTSKELLELDNEELLYRLFHEETCRLFEPDVVAFKCECSRERCANALRTMQREELDEVVHEMGAVDITCQFCNQHYSFDSADIEQLFSDGGSAEAGDQVH